MAAETLKTPSRMLVAAQHKQREDRMFRAIESYYRSLQPFRTLNRNLVREYAGHNYGSGRAKQKKYINKLQQAVAAHMMLLAANRPQVMVQTEYRELKPFAKHYQVAVNNLIKEIELEKTIRDWVLSAMFSMGVVKVHLKESGMVRYEGDVAADPGIPFASNVGQDNWFHDMSVSRYEQIKIAGDQYRIPVSQVDQGVSDGVYLKHALDILPTSKSLTDVDPDRVDAISRGRETDIDEFEPMVDVADIWLPEDRVIKTYPVINRRDFVLGGPAIAEMDWDGDEHGPYHLLSIGGDVPENIVSVPPAANWEALDEFINITFRKISRQTNRMKELMCFNQAGSKDAARIKSAQDGEGILVSDLNNVGRWTQGGADPNLAVTVQNTLHLFSQMANNLDSILGQGPQADTLGQEEIIHAAGNRIAASMQYRVVEAATKLTKSLGYLLWNDQFKEMAGTIEAAGGNRPIPANWVPGDREGNVQQYNFSINMSSMPSRTPSQQSTQILAFVTNVLIPMQPALAAQGMSINFSALVEMVAELNYLPELRSIVTTTGMPMSPESKPSVDSSGKPATTNRNYTRTSRSAGAPPSGQELVYQQPHMNGSSNGSASGMQFM